MSKKAEARLAKKLEKELKRIGKSVRLREEPVDNQVRAEFASSPDGVVRAGANPCSVFAMQMRWTDVTADRDGIWSWGVARDWGEATWQATLKPKLDEFAKLRWSEIESQTYGNAGKRHRCHHGMPTAEICGEARLRLAEIACDYETMFRFRLGNLPRLWGVRVVDEFQIYWYDPTHQIYPVD